MKAITKIPNLKQAFLCSIVAITVAAHAQSGTNSNPPPPTEVPLAVNLWSPTNSQCFAAPGRISLLAQVADTNVVRDVQYWAAVDQPPYDWNLVGYATNTAGVLLNGQITNFPFGVTWSNVPAGNYLLLAFAEDGQVGVPSAEIHIHVTNAPVAPPVTNHPGSITLLSPSNGSTYVAPARLLLSAQVTDTNAVYAVQFFSGSNFITRVTNTLMTNVFSAIWSNIPAGTYNLTARSTDAYGHDLVSGGVTIAVNSASGGSNGVGTNSVPPPPAASVTLLSPTNGASYAEPGRIVLAAEVSDTNPVYAVQFYSGSNLLTTATNVVVTNVFSAIWSNVPSGTYDVTARSTDDLGNRLTSAIATVTVRDGSTGSNGIGTNSVPPPPPNPSLTVSLWTPTNGQRFAAFSSIPLLARVADTNVVRDVQYWAAVDQAPYDWNVVGYATNVAGILLNGQITNFPFGVTWSNVPAGNYLMLAVADDGQTQVPSAEIHISVTNAPTEPTTTNNSGTITLLSPTNGASFNAPGRVALSAQVSDTNPVYAVQFYSGSNVITTATNAFVTNMFSAIWSNVPSGTYDVTARSTDGLGNRLTSAIATVTVSDGSTGSNGVGTNSVPPPPPSPSLTVSLWTPTNGQRFTAQSNISLLARVADTNVVRDVQYWAAVDQTPYDWNLVGYATNAAGVLLNGQITNFPFEVTWSNVPAGNFLLLAVADDGQTQVPSAEIHISVTNALVQPPPTNAPPSSNALPVVTIYATDPVACEGTNYNPASLPPSLPGNSNYYWSGTNTATFLIRRDVSAISNLSVNYSIGGTASNGVDYAAIGSSVTIPAGRRFALVTISPLNNGNTNRSGVTVVLTIQTPSNAVPTYQVGSPSEAGAVIVERSASDLMWPMVQPMADHSVYVSIPASNGTVYCMESSTNLLDWNRVCTNTVLKGSAQYVDPNGSSGLRLFYRIVPAAAPTY